MYIEHAFQFYPQILDRYYILTWGFKLIREILKEFFSGYVGQCTKYDYRSDKPSCQNKEKSRHKQQCIFIPNSVQHLKRGSSNAF